MPINREAERPQEYAYDGSTFARMVRAIRLTGIAATFENRANNWRNSFDAKTSFIWTRRRDGSFCVPFDPIMIGYGPAYSEGDAWRQGGFVPQNARTPVGKAT